MDEWSMVRVTSGDLDGDQLDAARPREQLPRLHRPGEIMGEVTAEAARLTGLKAGTPVIAGGGDGQEERRRR